MKIKKYKQSSLREPISIHEDFIPYHTKALDSKNRITLGGKLAKTLGKRMKIEGYQIFLGKNGDILLRPTVSIPSNEAWIYQNHDVTAKIRKGLEEAREGKTEKANNLDSFLDAI